MAERTRSSVYVLKTKASLLTQLIALLIHCMEFFLYYSYQIHGSASVIYIGEMLRLPLDLGTRHNCYLRALIHDA